MGSACKDVECKKCKGVAMLEYYTRTGEESVVCGACGWRWRNNGEESGGHGAVAYQVKGAPGFWQSSLVPDEKFPPDDLESLEWVWYTRPVGDRWEGVMLKGETKPDPHLMVGIVGLLPLYADYAKEAP